MEWNWLDSALEDIFDDVVMFRRHIHQHPELSFQETETADFIEKQLSELTFSRYCKTGLSTTILANHTDHNSCIALRADIDALPIVEKTDLPFASKNYGVMHACGHDMHTAILMGVAKIVQRHRDKLSKNVKFIFQLGEEKLPGGASMMIDAGVLENPKVDEMYGLHVFPELETGKVGFRSGPYMASCDEIYVTIHGKGGHAALPHKIIDPIFIASQIVTQAQSIVSRCADPTIPSVLSFGHFEAIGSTNIIPENAILKGTFRTMNEVWRAQAHQLFRDLVQNTVDSYGAKADVKIEIGYPFLVNHERTTSYAKNIAENVLGMDNVIELPIRMTAEDFSYYSQKVPATFFRLGVTPIHSDSYFGLHNNKFNPDEAAMKVGMKTMLSIVFGE